MLSLYVHIPFCVKKCPYCGFYSTPYDKELSDRYLLALRTELASHVEEFAGRRINTVYIGGGTPTALSTEQLHSLFSFLRCNVPLDRDTELTVEVNPGTVSADKIKLLKDAGTTRLSIGVQSFSDRILCDLGRIHTADQARQAVLLSREIGFSNINIDLIYAVPGQSNAEWLQTLDSALQFAPEHLSLYSLTLEDGTEYARAVHDGRIVMLEDDIAVSMYSVSCQVLEGAGYEHYELSNFARKGFSCKHNLNYWARNEYLGFGAGAWSFRGGLRRQNIADVHEYIARVSKGASLISFRESPDIRQAEVEYLFLALRRAEGVDLEGFAATFGTERRDALLAAVEVVRSHGLFDMNERFLRLSNRGKSLANEAMTALMP